MPLAEPPIPDGPSYEDFFERGSLLSWARHRDPYRFAQTYHLMRRCLGYQANYVNFGYWDDGEHTPEPGRRLALLAGRALGLKAGDHLLEGGSGLGQSAVDLCGRFELARVVGLNPCRPQVDFANALAATSGLTSQVSHRVADACTAFPELDGRFDHALALECIGHFPDPVAWFRGLGGLLPAGGRVAFTLVTCPSAPGPLLRRVMGLTFGVVPEDGAAWTGRLEAAGLRVVERSDITELVLAHAFSFAARRLRELSPAELGLNALQRAVLLRLAGFAGRAVAEGRLGYELIAAEVPGAAAQA